MLGIKRRQWTKIRRLDMVAASVLLMGLALGSRPSRADTSPFPATAPQSVFPPSTVSRSVAGTSSASSFHAPFVPQQAFETGEAEPVFVAAIPQPVTKTASEQAASANLLWQDILTRYTKRNPQGLVCFDYAALRATPKDMQKLSEYLSLMQAMKPSAMSRDEALAYWANLYNALTIDVVTRHYPIKSIREIKFSWFHAGPWRRKFVRVEGRDLSLDDIEKGIMRPQFKTPFIHYMVNCASISCPNLKTPPWHAATLQADLQAAARDYINSPRGVKFENGQLKLSSIYKWYARDFGGQAQVLSHLRRFANADLRSMLDTHPKIDKYVYDWALNTP